jgi:FAD/FMN-containing dehydrogenase
MNQGILNKLEQIVGSSQTFTDAKVLETFSKDQYAFSPVLLEMLREKRADVMVAPDSSEQLSKIVSLAALENIPLTIRGAGSGNYGQAVPLHGGILVSLHRFNQILEIDPTAQTARVQAGVRLGNLEREARKHGLELRFYPSTWATATVGGFVGGGFGGVGSIQYGTLWDDLILKTQVLAMTENPKLEQLTGSDIFAVIHAYGTTAIMTELTIRLAPATNWEESVFSFPSLENAIAFAQAIAQETKIKKREIGIFEAPMPNYFKPLEAAGGVREGRTAVILELEEAATLTLEARAAQLAGTLDYFNPHATYHHSSFALSDFTWNHTTLWAMKAEHSWTYTQARFEVDQMLEQVRAIKAKFGDEVLMHLEFIRERINEGGVLVAASLPLIRFTTKDRLFEIQAFFEAIGVQVADPHTFYLDEDSRWSGEAVLNGVARFNPKGLLNPGKLKVLETGENAVLANSWFGTTKTD